MDIEQIADEALRLKPEERAALAKTIWESLDDPYVSLPESSDEEALHLARQRDHEMEVGAVEPVSHQELMDRLSKDAA